MRKPKMHQTADLVCLSLGQLGWHRFVREQFWLWSELAVCRQTKSPTQLERLSISGLPTNRTEPLFLASQKPVCG